VLNLLYLARNDPGRAEQYLSMAEDEVNRVAAPGAADAGFVRDTKGPSRLNPAKIMDEILLLYSSKLESKRILISRRLPHPVAKSTVTRGSCGSC